MSKLCELTGKRPQTGHNVSHANNKTKRRFFGGTDKYLVRTGPGSGGFEKSWSDPVKKGPAPQCQS